MRRPECVYMHYIHGSTLRDQERVSESVELEIGAIVSFPTWVLGTEPGPLKGQHMFFTLSGLSNPSYFNFHIC